MLKKIISFVLSWTLIISQPIFAQGVAQINLGNYLRTVGSSMAADKFRPLHMRYFSYDAVTDNFQLLLDKGDNKDIKEAELQEKTKVLMEYFQIGLALPNEKFWVNLRPDAQDQIIDPELEKTDMGRIMLEADLQLKKDTAGWTSPQNPEGKQYWDKLYKKAGELFGSENITIPTITRPWIVPGEIILRQGEDSAYIFKANMKVMLEQDHLKGSQVYDFKDPRMKDLNEYSSQLIRELIIPRLTKEVNTSKRYAPLRQVFFSLVMARWFKDTFQGKPGQYAQLIDSHNLNNLTSKEAWSKTYYFNEYKKSFEKGEYNLKEQIATPSGQAIRSYVSGGVSSAIMTMPPAGLYKGRKHLNAVNAGYENGRFTIKKYPGGKESNNKKRFSSVTGSSPLTSDKIEEEIKDIRENFIAPFYALVKKFRTWRDDGEKQGWLPNSSNGINGRSEGYKSLMNNLQIEKFYKDDHAKYEFGLIVESMESVMSGLGYNYSWRINDDGSIDAFQRREKPQTNKEWKESIEVWTKIIEYYIKEIEKFNKKAMKSRLLPDYEKDEVILDGVKVLHILREVVARRLSILKEAVGGASSALNNQQIAPEQVSPSLSAIDFSSVKVLDQMKESFSDAIIHLEGEIFGKHDIFMFGKELQRIDSAESKEILLNELIEIVRKLKGQHTSDKSKILIWDVIKDFRNIVSKVIDEPQDFINKLTRIQEEIESSSTSSSAIMPGGIDFRTMNYMVQPMGSFKDLRFMLPTLTSNALERIDLDKELESLRDMVKAGMVPSGMRVKEYLAACFQKGKIEEKQDDLLVCLAEIYRLAEEENLETSPELRESLVIVDTGKFVLLPNNQRVGLN